MTAAASLPYRVRPNKAVDRELFLSLLTRLAPSLDIAKYHYIGLGGPFLEDFRLIHARLGIRHMTCVESDPEVYKRQRFNRPIQSVDCVHTTLEGYLAENYLDDPVVIWFDFTDPGNLVGQINCFSSALGAAPVPSVFRVTLNANPGSLGDPPADEVSVELDGVATRDRSTKPTVQEWRLQRFRERLGDLFPIDLDAAGMQRKQFGKSVLRVLSLAVAKAALSLPDRRIVWALATHYADGQPMVTATLITCPSDDRDIQHLVQGWEFRSTPEDPLRIDLPALSTLERLTLEAQEDPVGVMGYELPRSEMGSNPMEVFRQFYRIYPHFSRVDL